MKTFARLFLSIALGAASVAAQAAVTATLDRDQIEAGDTVQLILQRDHSSGGDPDLSPLKQDFEILGSSSGTSIQYVNGHVSQQRQLQLSLSPKHSGTLRIPSLNWAGEQTVPLQLTVTNGAGASGSSHQNGDEDAQQPQAAAKSPHVFLTSTLEPKQPFVQGTAVLTVRLHTDQALQQPSLDFPGNDAVTVQQLGKDQQSSETRNGHRYEVVERSYLLLPQRSGTVTLEGPTLDAQIVDTRSRNPFDDDSFFSGTPFAGMLGATRPLRIHGDPIQLEVQPRPASITSGDWLPAKQIKLEQRWRPDGGSTHVGEPMTLHLRMEATGLTAAQLPDLASKLKLPDGLKAYPDQAKLDTTMQGGEVTGVREQDIAVIASQPGPYGIPPLAITWWDIVQNVPHVITLQIPALDVQPAVGGSAPVAPPPSPSATDDSARSSVAAPAAPLATEPEQPGAVRLGGSTGERHTPWIWVSAALALLWLATLLLFWVLRRRPAPEPQVPSTRTAPLLLDSASARKAFHQACKDNTPRLARRNLLAWAAQVSPDHPPSGLEALAAHFDDARVSQLLAQLDRACFTGGEWNGQALSARLQDLPAPSTTASKAPLLPPLYS
jgi:hypothetical protein